MHEISKAPLEKADKLFDFNVNSDYDIQKSSVRLLEKVADIFIANNLTYWIQGGTLLRAVKNKGMLQWDDDQDLCVMIEDYEKFLSLKEQFSLFDITTAPCLFFYKLTKVTYIDVFFYFRSENDSLLLKDLNTKKEQTKNIYFKNDYFKKYSDVFPLKKYNYEYFQVWSE